ncbi:MAG: hypothetical protein A2V83_08430 [Nitrospirae bacterium RBG_16_64_22]|nr:MAG: hypothetical protein A2V83_08430 [Nitrospirae bacterium RBG_16_64_22]
MRDQKIKTTCFHDCNDACGMIATVRDGRVVKLEGDPGNPYTQGFLCGKMQRFPRWQDSPERLLKPIRKKGAGWEEISWDAALDLCAERLRSAVDKHGPLSILFELAAGNFGMVRLAGRFFFGLLGGATTTTGSLCDAAGEKAQEDAFGACLTHDPRDVLDSKLIVGWGKNVATTHLHFLPFIKEARKKGARFFVVDPLPTATARMADLWLQPKPGSDIFLALAIGRILLEQVGVDESFVRNRTEGWEAYRSLLARFSLEELCVRCDVSLSAAREFALAYGRTRPASIWTGTGVQHYRWGREAHLAISALGAMTGNLGVSGGGVSFNHPSALSFDRSAFDAPGSLIGKRTVLKPILGEEIARLTDPPIHAAWFHASNIVTQSQDTGGILRALARVPFKVALDIYMTDTARACDIVLPVSTFLEREDVRGSYGDRTVGYMARVVEPPPGVLSDLEIYQALAERLGFGEKMRGGPEDWIRMLIKPLEACGIGFETLREKGQVVSPLIPDVPFAGGRFKTTSGRYRFPADLRLPDDGPPPGSLFLVTPKAKAFQNSEILAEEDQGVPKAFVHPDAAPGLSDGEEADLVSSVGRLRVRVSLDGRMRRDAVRVDQGGHHARGACVNALAPPVLSWDGGGACYYETIVRLERPPGSNR